MKTFLNSDGSLSDKVLIKSIDIVDNLKWKLYFKSARLVTSILILKILKSKYEENLCHYQSTEYWKNEIT